MRAHELRTKSESDLEKMLTEERERVRDLTFRVSGAQLKNTHEIHSAKKNIARILTVLNNVKKESKETHHE